MQNDSINSSDYNGLNRTGSGRGNTRGAIQPNHALIEIEARMLLNAIREIQPNYMGPATIRATTSPRYNRDDINSLRGYYLSITNCTPCISNRKPGPSTNPLDPHNAKIRAVAEQLENDGGRIIAGGGRFPERLIKTISGHKNGRRPDILYSHTDGTLRGVNVGRVDANGRPVPREQKALDDLNGPGGLPTTFECYFPLRKPK